MSMTRNQTIPITRRKRLFAVLAVAVGLCLAAVGIVPAANATQSTGGNELVGTTSPGLDIFNTQQAFGYRYGPSIIRNSDGSFDMWTCAPGSGGPWDEVMYRHSTDGGNTWSADQAVLTATAGSADNFSVCDPGVFVDGGYYYIGYTSTANSTGFQNNLFVARSTSPTGPYAKWNGSGWGGNPAPIVTYTGPSNGYGAGEPSFVVRNGVISAYYTWIDGTVNETRLETAPSSANWPASLSSPTTVIVRPGDGNLQGSSLGIVEDSTDIKYSDALNEYIGITVENRLEANSYVRMYTSPDGIHFTISDLIDHDQHGYAANIGISGDSQGHINTTGPNFIAYAYGPTRGDWATRLSPISFSTQLSGTDFEGFSGPGTSPWTGGTGTWGESGGAMTNTSTGGTNWIGRPGVVFSNAVYSYNVSLSGATESDAWEGLTFSQLSPGDSYGTSGYMVFLRANGNVDLWKAGAGVVVGDTATGTNPTTSTVPVKVVKNGAEIQVYVGSATTPQIDYFDSGSPYTSGYMGLATTYTSASFSAFVVSNNVNDAFTTESQTQWTNVAGSWAWSSGHSYTQSNATADPAAATYGGQIYGDASYTASVELANPGSPQSWVGLNVLKSSPTTTYTGDGYIAYLRANGNVSLFKTGVGDLVSNVATGTNPVGNYVQLKVVVSEETIKVYVGTSTEPKIVWTSSTPLHAGYIGLDTVDTQVNVQSFGVNTQAQ
jgi:hypothetical protein